MVVGRLLRNMCPMLPSRPTIGLTGRAAVTAAGALWVDIAAAVGVASAAVRAAESARATWGSRRVHASTAHASGFCAGVPGESPASPSIVLSALENTTDTDVSRPADATVVVRVGAALTAVVAVAPVVADACILIVGDLTVVTACVAVLVLASAACAVSVPACDFDDVADAA